MPDQLPKAEFAFPGPLRDKLVAAILSGEKTSTTALLADYEDENEPLPQAGGLAAIVDSHDRPVAIMRAGEVRLCRLADLDLQHVLDEGEGDTGIDTWLAGHTKFWHSYRPGFVVHDDVMLVLERFSVVRRLFDAETVNAAFAAESAALSQAIGEIGEAEAALPTRCPPWTVKDELAHTAMAVHRTSIMLDAPPPEGEPIQPHEYYRADKRFDAEAGEERVASARTAAGRRTLREVGIFFEEQWKSVATRVTGEGPERTVVTRWGDPMMLTDFMVTRVVEVAVHGLDLADALGAQPWLTDAASDVVEALIVPSGGQALRRRLGWDRPQLLRKLTGRAELTPAERSTVDNLSTATLTFG